MSSPEPMPPAELPSLPPPLAAAPAPAPGPAARTEKAPWVALLLSLVMPGLGQLYNGEVSKALASFFGFSGCIYLMIEGHPLPFAIVLPFVIFWNMIDAYRSAALINARGTAAPPEAEVAESPGWGIALAAMGVLLLLNNMGWLRLGALVPYWPVLLIVAGLFLLRRSLQRKDGHGPSL